MSSENAAVLAEEGSSGAAPALPGATLIKCRFRGKEFVTTLESCQAIGGTVLSVTVEAIEVMPDELIVCQLSGQDFVTTPESCQAMGGTIVGQSSPGIPNPT